MSLARSAALLLAVTLPPVALASPVATLRGTVTDLPLYGGTGGGAFSDACPDGYAVTGFRQRPAFPAPGTIYVSQARATCTEVSVDPVTGTVTFGLTASTPARGST